MELLQLQLKEAQNDLHDSESVLRQSVTLCGTLLERLEDLVKFLNSLLQNKDIGPWRAELKKAITRAVDRSLDSNCSINFNQLSLSQNTNISDLSMIELVDSIASSTIADSLIDSLNGDNFSFKTEIDSSKVNKASNASSLTKSHKAQKNIRKSLASMFMKQNSESEEWSEPDRDISKERIGLSTADESVIKQRISTTSDEDDHDDNDAGSEHKLVRKADWKLIHEKIKSLEGLLQEKNDKILEMSSILLDAENDAKDKILQIKRKLDETEQDLEHYKALYHQITKEKCDLLKDIQDKTDIFNHIKSEKDKINLEYKMLSSKFETQVGLNHELKSRYKERESKLHTLKLEYESKCKTYEQLVTASEKREQLFKDELQQNWVRKTIYNQVIQELDKKQERLKDYQQKFATIEGEMRSMQSHLLESEAKLEKISKNLDSATLQLSSASVDRSKALNEKRLLETKFKKISEEHHKLNVEKQELNLKIADLEVFNAKLQNKLLIGDKMASAATHLSDASGYASEEANAIRSASFSSNDEKDIERYSNCTTCKVLANEMNEIKRNLNQSKRSLELAYSKLRNQNLRKAQIEMDIKQQIVKTQNVLQNVRTNMENELSRTTSIK
jgi:centrosomin